MLYFYKHYNASKARRTDRRTYRTPLSVLTLQFKLKSIINLCYSSQISNRWMNYSIADISASDVKSHLKLVAYISHYTGGF